MTAPSPGRRRIALLALGSLLLGGLIAGNGLVSCGAATTPTAVDTRPVTRAEATRLAGVRLADYRAGHAGVRVSIGTGTNAVHLTGWVDWRQPLIYLNSIGQTAGPADGLLQAIPGVVAVHPGRYTPVADGQAIDPFPAPPVEAPHTGWEVRPIARGSAVDTMITLLFALRSKTADDAPRIASIGTRFVMTDRIGGVPVDVLDGAAVPPTRGESPAPTPSAAALPFADRGGQVRYWVDANSHLLRAEALVDPTTTLRIDFDRTDPVSPEAIELLGGAPINPKKPTKTQLTQVSQMRAHDYLAGGGRITIAMPVATDQLVSAVGWLDWRSAAAYLTVRNIKGSGPDATLRADRLGVTMHGSLDATGPNGTNSAAGDSDATRPALKMPSLKPAKGGWHRSSWASRQDAYGETDLDGLLNELLALGAAVIDSPGALKPLTSRLRTDKVNGAPVTVYEIRKATEKKNPVGTSRMRYWIDASGRLVRLELRTRNGAYGYATIDPGPVPMLPDPIPAG